MRKAFDCKRNKKANNIPHKLVSLSTSPKKMCLINRSKILIVSMQSIFIEIIQVQTFKRVPYMKHDSLIFIIIDKCMPYNAPLYLLPKYSKHCVYQYHMYIVQPVYIYQLRLHIFHKHAVTLDTTIYTTNWSIFRNNFVYPWCLPG